MSHPARPIWGLLLVMFLLLPGAPASARAEAPVEVTVSIQPQKYFVEKIGGDLVSVTVMVEPGVDPHVYDPKPQKMAGLTRSKVYFAVGAPFEAVWLGRFAAANPKMLIVRTDAGIAKLPMEHDHDGPQAEGGHGEDPAAAEEHRHGEGDPHVWVSPPLAMIQARHILDGLLKVDPAHWNAYATNYRQFIGELVELDEYLLNLFRDKPRAEFVVFHPAWGYFAEAYGLKQVPVEVEGKEPKAADLKRLIEDARKSGIKAIFVQPQYSGRSASVVAEAVGARVETADPMSADWARNLREVGQKIRASLK